MLLFHSEKDNLESPAQGLQKKTRDLEYPL